MATEDIIARGVGFSPGAVKFIVTHGLAPGSLWTAVAPDSAVWTGETPDTATWTEITPDTATWS